MATLGILGCPGSDSSTGNPFLAYSSSLGVGVSSRGFICVARSGAIGTERVSGARQQFVPVDSALVGTRWPFAAREIRRRRKTILYMTEPLPPHVTIAVRKQFSRCSRLAVLVRTLPIRVDGKLETPKDRSEDGGSRKSTVDKDSASYS